MRQHIQTLLVHATIEAANLRNYATKEERNRLDYKSSCVFELHNSFYGQLTGDALSIRANELIVQCAERVYVPSTNEEIYTDNLKSLALGGAPTIVTPPSKRRSIYHTPLEVLFILCWECDNAGYSNGKMIFDYVKGDIDTLLFPKQVTITIDNPIY